MARSHLQHKYSFENYSVRNDKLKIPVKFYWKFEDFLCEFAYTYFTVILRRTSAFNTEG